MKVQTFKIVINNRVFMRIVYSVDSVIYNIIIFEKIKDHVFKEIFPIDVGTVLQEKIVSDEYIQECDKSEILEFMEDVLQSEKEIEKGFIKYIEEDENRPAKVISFENYMGIKSGLVKQDEKDIPEALRIVDDGEMGFGYVTQLPQNLAFYQVLNMAIKQDLLHGEHFIQVSENAYYGIRTEGKYTYFAEIIFDFESDKVSCNFVVPVKQVKNAVKMISEITPEMTKILDKNVKTLIHKLLEKLNAEEIEGTEEHN